MTGFLIQVCSRPMAFSRAGPRPECQDGPTVVEIGAPRLRSAEIAFIRATPQKSWSAERRLTGRCVRRRPGANSQHGCGKSPGRLVRQGMACLDGAVLVTPDEHSGVIGRPAGLQRIFDAVE